MISQIIFYHFYKFHYRIYYRIYYRIHYRIYYRIDYRIYHRIYYRRGAGLGLAANQKSYEFLGLSARGENPRNP